jgi:hypothetical protein
MREGVLSFHTEYDCGLLARIVGSFFCHRNLAVAFRPERRYPKFEVLGSVFRKPRPSSDSPVARSRSAILRECVPVVPQLPT